MRNRNGRRRQRGSISADHIIEGAFEVARANSLAKLSMPTLAAHLDVGVTSIYWYFRKKENLLNAMTDVAVDRYLSALPPVRGNRWQTVLEEHFSQQRRIFMEDETLCDLVLIRTSTYSREATRRVFSAVEELVEVLVNAGFTPSNAMHVYSTISVYTRGIIILDRILRLSDAPTLDERQSRIADWSEMPVLQSLVDTQSFSGTRGDNFAFGVSRLICGFEVLLKEQPPQ